MRRALILLCILFPVGTAPLRAQTTGDIIGIVSDESGGALPGVTVSIGTTVEENVTLKVGQHTEEVTVVGGAPVIDTKSNQVSTTYDKDWVRNAPISRFTFFDIINEAPGVTQSSTG